MTATTDTIDYDGLTRVCPAHGTAMVPNAIGAVHCPEPGCREFRRTTCGAFVRRVRPQGYTITCQRPVERETYAIGPSGERVYHGGRCGAHPDTARYGAAPGWRIVFEEANRA